MKCLIRMAADEGKGMIFYETVLNIKWQKHTFIECVPIPLDQFHDLPQYFKVNLAIERCSRALFTDAHDPGIDPVIRV